MLSHIGFRTEFVFYMEVTGSIREEKKLFT